MDNILEIIVPLIFAAIYFFGNMFSGKNDDESAPKSAPRRGNEDQEADAIERQRRIQEEIRRKIMERRREAGGTASRAEPVEGRTQESTTARDLRQRREAVQSRRAEREQQKQGRAAGSRTAPTDHLPEESVSSLEPAFSWDASGNAYESQMQARLQQIEATKRRAEKLKQQAAANSTGSAGASSRRTDSGKKFGLFRGPVRSSLRDPAAARAAFIYAEVLGQPISQRRSPAVPGLSN